MKHQDQQFLQVCKEKKGQKIQIWEETQPKSTCAQHHFYQTPASALTPKNPSQTSDNFLKVNCGRSTEVTTRKMQSRGQSWGDEAKTLMLQGLKSHTFFFLLRDSVGASGKEKKIAGGKCLKN